MSLARGARLGPYEIISPLGSGGMGDVYKARDTRLERLVAVKTLRNELAGFGDARERFEREARVISSLSHPHVCAIHDVGHADGIEYLVMELLEGETLADRIAKGALPLADVIRNGIQIAEALAAAHRQGIVHRDLKPGNVMITAAGLKLLDFGLAKLVEPATPTGADAAMTAQTALTREGTWLGTAPYMAPEQIQGKTATARSDIFALGAVLFEMATGRRAFPGTTPSEIAAAIMHQEPPRASSVTPVIPAAFDRLVSTCLAKDPDRRWQDAHDVALQLAIIGEHSEERHGEVPSEPVHWRRGAPLAWVVAAAAILVAGAGWLRPVRAPAIASTRTELQILPPRNGSFLNTFETVTFAVSPDGARLAFVAADPGSARRIWIRPLASIEATPVAGTNGAISVFWSPDSRSIGFFADGALKRLDLASGTAVTLCSVQKNIGLTGTWNTDGQILFGSIEGDALYRVATSGGEPTAEIKPDRSHDEARVVFPSFLRGGRKFLYLLRMADNSGRLMLGEIGKSRTTVMPVDSNVAYVDPGVLVFAREGTLVGQPFDSDTGTLRGESFALTKSIRFLMATGMATFSASSSGPIVYQPQHDRSRLAWLDRAGHEVEAIDAPGDYLDLRISPSGRAALASRTLPSTGSYDVWSLDLDRHTETRLTLDDRLTEINPVLASDSDTMIYSVNRRGPPRLMRKSLSTGHEEFMMPAGPRLQGADDISPDGSVLAYEERTDQGNYNLWTLPLSGSAPPLVLRASPFNETGLRFSPDGRYYSFMSNESGRLEVYVSPVSGGAKTVVSAGGAGLARWGRDGRELFYLTGDRRLVAVPVRTAPTLALGSPTTLFAISGKPWVDFDVSTDSKRFLAVIADVISNEQPLTALVNWTAAPPQ